MMPLLCSCFHLSHCVVVMYTLYSELVMKYESFPLDGLRDVVSLSIDHDRGWLRYLLRRWSSCDGCLRSESLLPNYCNVVPDSLLQFVHFTF